MLKYILKRILLLIPVLIGATFIVFFVMDMTPGDPAVAKLGVDATAEQIEELREEMGLNDPFPVRYGRFVLDLVRESGFGQTGRLQYGIWKEIQNGSC